MAIRRVLSEKSWIEFDVAAGNGPSFSLKGFRTLTKWFFCTAVTQFQFTPEEVKAGLVTCKSATEII